MNGLLYSFIKTWVKLSHRPLTCIMKTNQLFLFTVETSYLWATHYLAKLQWILPSVLVIPDHTAACHPQSHPLLKGDLNPPPGPHLCVFNSSVKWDWHLAHNPSRNGSFHYYYFFPSAPCYQPNWALMKYYKTRALSRCSAEPGAALTETSRRRVRLYWYCKLMGCIQIILNSI